MRKNHLPALLTISALLIFTPSSLFAQEAAPAGARPASTNTAILPALRSTPTNWVARHEGFLEITRKGNIDLLFLGDSITDGWRGRGSAVWNRFYAPRRAANFGIGGDRTEHVLWRLNQGELEGLKPKVVVLMIGTNNTGKEKDGRPRNTIPEIIEGVTAVVAEIRTRLPDSKILLLGIFPRGNIDDPQRGQVAVINTALAKLDDGRKVKYLDIGPEFLEADGTLPRSIMPDLLHPNEQGYQIWAAAMNPSLDALMQ